MTDKNKIAKMIGAATAAMERDEKNHSIIKIIAKHTREMSELRKKFGNLMIVHMETLDKYMKSCFEVDDLKLKISELETLLDVAGQEIKELMGDYIEE